MSLVFTELFHNDFLGGNENPIDPLTWHNRLNPAIDDQLIIQSHIFTTSTSFEKDGQGMFIPAIPNDQYIEFKVSQSTEITLTDYYIRGVVVDIAPCYILTYVGPTDVDSAGDGTSAFYVSQYINSSGTQQHDFMPTMPLGLPFRVNTGDVIRFGVVGQASGFLFIQVNGTVIWSAALSGSPSLIASGFVGTQFALDPLGGTPGLAGATRFATGSVSGSLTYSVPDDRNYATFPNNSRDVQGTATYDVGAHPSHTNPTDSRTQGAPVDSRKDPNIPENSRTS